MEKVRRVLAKIAALIAAIMSIGMMIFVVDVAFELGVVGVILLRTWNPSRGLLSLLDPIASLVCAGIFFYFTFVFWRFFKDMVDVLRDKT